MASIAVPKTMEADLSRKLLDILADTMIASAIVADVMTMELAAGTSASVTYREACTKLVGVYRAAIIRLEGAEPHPATEDAPPFTRPQMFH